MEGRGSVKEVGGQGLEWVTCESHSCRVMGRDSVERKCIGPGPKYSLNEQE